MFTFGISSYLFNNCRFTYKAINVCIITHLSSDGNQFSYQFSAKLFLCYIQVTFYLAFYIRRLKRFQPLKSVIE